MSCLVIVCNAKGDGSIKIGPGNGGGASGRCKNNGMVPSHRGWFLPVDIPIRPRRRDDSQQAASASRETLVAFGQHLALVFRLPHMFFSHRSILSHAANPQIQPFVIWSVTCCFCWGENRQYFVSYYFYASGQQIQPFVIWSVTCCFCWSVNVEGEFSVFCTIATSASSALITPLLLAAVNALVVFSPCFLRSYL